MANPRANVPATAGRKQQTFIDTYNKIEFAKLYDRKTPVTAAELLNDRVLPFFEQDEIPLNRISLTAAQNTVVHQNGMSTNCTSP
jgi:hypothetical protein